MIAKTPIKLLSLLILVNFSMVAIGCGGGSGGAATTASSPPTKAQYVKQANTICKQGTEKKEKLLAAATEESGKALFDMSEGEVEDLAVEVIFPLYGNMLSQLEALNPPAKSKKAAEEVVGNFEQILNKVEGDPSLLFSQPFDQANKAASRYGLVACSFY